MDIHAKFELQDCPYCGGAGLLEEENGWCWYVTCMDCGSHTASFEFKTPQESEEAAGKAAALLAETGSAQRSDCLLDRACFQKLRQLAEEG